MPWASREMRQGHRRGQGRGLVTRGLRGQAPQARPIFVAAGPSGLLAGFAADAWRQENVANEDYGRRCEGWMGAHGIGEGLRGGCPRGGCPGGVMIHHGSCRGGRTARGRGPGEEGNGNGNGSIRVQRAIGTASFQGPGFGGPPGRESRIAYRSHMGVAPRRAAAPRCGRKVKTLTVIPARPGNPWAPLIISKRHATSWDGRFLA